MSKTVKSVASIALPIALSYFAPGIGTALGSTLSASSLGAIGGAVGGGIGGAINGGGVGGVLKGAAMGAAGGYLGNGGASELFGGTAIGDALGLANPATAGANATGLPSNAIPAPTSVPSPVASAPAGAASTGNGLFRALGPVSAGLSIGNALLTANGVDAAKEAAKIQAAAIDRAVATQAPYNELGTAAAQQIKQIQADPGAYVQNNPFYASLADDAQRRLLANQAAKGKVGSGGTAAALHEQLLNLGNGLVQQQVGTLQNQVNSGQNAANTTSNLQTDRGAVQASGVMGANNAMQTGYQNQINTLLALQSLNKVPAYAPTATARI